MPLVTPDRAKETTTTTGTGAVTLAGAAAGFQAFSSSLSTGDSTYYCITDGTSWEVGKGTLTSSTTLTRDTVFASSNSNALVSWSAGSKDVFSTIPGPLLDRFEADGTLSLQVFGVNATPAASDDGDAHLFTRTVAGRTMPAFVGASGLDSALQPLLGRNNVSFFRAIPGSTTLTANGLAITATGTATSKTTATTNLHTQTAGVDFLVTTAATTAVAGFRTGANQYWSGNAAGLGGFTYVCRFSPATGTTIATDRCFTGMQSSTSAPTDVNPSTLTNMIGVGYDAADTTWQIMWNGTGTATKVNTGITIPSTDRASVYEIALFAAPNSTTVNYEFRDLGNSTSVFTGTASSGLFSNTTLLSPRGYHSVGGTSSVVGYTLFTLYVETDI